MQHLRGFNLENIAIISLLGREHSLLQGQDKLGPWTLRHSTLAERDVADAMDFFRDHAGAVVAARFLNEFERVAKRTVFESL